MKICVFDTKDELNKAFTNKVEEFLSQKGHITLSLSGGSTPKALFDYWASLPEGKINWSRIKFFWGDERCVPPNDPDSNYGMTRQHLFNKIQIPHKNIFRIHGETDPAKEAKRYGKLLDRELEKENSAPSFDILMLGMGDDGHTASIFPGEIGKWDCPENCVTATHPVNKQIRVSLTGKTINAARNVFFLVTGENKAEKVKAIIEERIGVTGQYPAARVQPASGNLFWFLDKEASRLLKK